MLLSVDAGYHQGGIGDIELAGVIDRCAAYTPVPGGVGPMTIATLMAQTLTAAEARSVRWGDVMSSGPPELPVAEQPV